VLLIHLSLDSVYIVFEVELIFFLNSPSVKFFKLVSNSLISLTNVLYSLAIEFFVNGFF